MEWLFFIYGFLFASVLFNSIWIIAMMSVGTEGEMQEGEY